MDLVDYAEERFDEIVRDFCRVPRAARGARRRRSSRSARCTATTSSTAASTCPGTAGLPLLEHLEAVDVVARPQPRRPALPGAVRDPRRRAATSAATRARSPRGDRAAGRPRRRAALRRRDDRRARSTPSTATLDEAVPGRERHAACSTDDVDVSRGDLICHADDRPSLEREFDADVCWFADRPLRAGGRYAIKHATHTVARGRRRAASTASTSTRLERDRRARAARPQRHRPRAPADRQAAGVRPLPAQPRAPARSSSSTRRTNDTVGGGMIAGLTRAGPVD